MDFSCVVASRSTIRFSSCGLPPIATGVCAGVVKRFVVGLMSLVSTGV